MEFSADSNRSAFVALLDRVFRKTFHATEADARSSQAAAGAIHSPDFKVISVLTITAVSLTMINFLGKYDFVRGLLEHFGQRPASEALGGFLTAFSNERMASLVWWSCMTVAFYFLMPAVYIRFVLKESLADYGLRAAGAFRDYGLYFLMFAVMLPLVWAVSAASSFQAKYPFYPLEQGESLFPYFWQWQFFYLLQFFALEFFFRGFMVHGLKHRFGFYSVFVMCVPYCMIHFQKPFLEALAAIVAGVVLGSLSLKSRSVLMGVAIHYSVAITMDLAALWRKGLLW